MLTFEGLPYGDNGIIAPTTSLGGLLFKGSTNKGLLYFTSGFNSNSTNPTAVVTPDWSSGPVTSLTIKPANSTDKFSITSLWLSDKFQMGASLYTITPYTSGVAGTPVNVAVWNDGQTAMLNFSTIDSLHIVGQGNVGTSGYRSVEADFDDLNYTIIPSAIPTVTTGGASSVTATTATLTGMITANLLLTADTLEYGLTTSYGTKVVANPATTNGSVATAISATVGGLTPNTTYHYRARGVNSLGTGYGGDMTFTTLAIVPTVTTGAASAITGTSATVAGTINANNATTADTVEYGLTTSYGTKKVMTPATATGTSATSVSAALTSLTPNTTYHYRVKGVNSAGTTNGLDATFTTAKIAPAILGRTVTTWNVGEAVILSTVHPNNDLTSIFVEYGTTLTYGTSVATTPATLTGTSYADAGLTLTGLLPATTYHFRIKASNSAGVTYSADSTFTTQGIKPEATADSVSANVGISALLHGTVTANNSSTTSYFDWGPTSSYGTRATVTSPATVTGMTPTAVAATITGLEPNTLYYYRLTAQSLYGTTNSTEGTFTSAMIAPSVFTDLATAVTDSSALFTGDIDPQNATTTAHFEYGVTTAYGSTIAADQPSFTGSSSATATATPVDLLPNTLYHYRVVGSNSAGTTHGNDQTFLTAMRAQTITFDSLAPRSYDPATKIILTATASSSLPVSYQILDENIATLSGDTLTIKGVGTTTISATQMGNSGYLQAPTVVRTLTITPAPLTITVLDTIKEDTMSDPLFTVTYTGFVNGEDSSVLTSPVVITREPGDTAGTYAVTPSSAVAPHYAITFVPGTLTIVHVTAITNRGTVAGVKGRGLVVLTNPASLAAGEMVFMVNDPEAQEITSTIFDPLGEVLDTQKRVVENHGKAHRMSWDLRSRQGSLVGMGSYLLVTQVKTATGEMRTYKAMVGVRR